MKRSAVIGVIVVVVAALAGYFGALAISNALAPKTSVVVSENLVVYEPGESPFEILESDLEAVRVSSLEGISEDTILNAGVTDATPHGLLRKIDWVEEAPGGGYLIHTKQAALTDAIKQCDIHAMVSLYEDGQYRVDVEGNEDGSLQLVENAYAFDFTLAELDDSLDFLNEQRQHGPLTASLKDALEFHIKIATGSIVLEAVNHFHAGLELDTGGVQVHEEGSATLFDKPLAPIVIPIGPVQVVFDNSISVDAEAAAKLEALRIVGEASVDKVFGYRYTTGVGVESVNEDHSVEPYINFGPDGDMFSVGADFGLVASLNSRLYGVAGPSMSAGVKEAVSASIKKLPDDMDSKNCLILPGIDWKLGGAWSTKVYVPISGRFVAEIPVNPFDGDESIVLADVELFNTGDFITLYEDGGEFPIPEIGSEGTSSSEDGSSFEEPADEPRSVDSVEGRFGSGDVSSYLPVIEEYAAIMSSSDIPRNRVYVNSEAWAAHYDPYGIARDRDLMYALVDLASDGVPELVVAYVFGSGGNGSGTSGGLASYRIYDLYGIQDGAPVRLVDESSLGYRATATLYQGGYVLHEGSSGAMDYQSDYYRLPSDSATLEFLESVRTTESGKTFTFADGTSKVGALSDDFRRQGEHFAVDNILEGLDWHALGDALPADGKVEQQANANSSSQAAPGGTHFQAAGWSFGIPQYWEGKVDIREEGGHYAIYSSEYPEALLVRFVVESSNEAKNEGDVAGGVVGWVEIGGGQRIAVVQKNWIWEFTRPGWNAEGYTPYQVDYLVDLVTGGQYKRDDVAPNIAAGESTGDTQAQLVWLRANLMPLVQAD